MEEPLINKDNNNNSDDDIEERCPNDVGYTTRRRKSVFVSALEVVNGDDDDDDKDYGLEANSSKRGLSFSRGDCVVLCCLFWTAVMNIVIYLHLTSTIKAGREITFFYWIKAYTTLQYVQVGLFLWFCWQRKLYFVWYSVAFLLPILGILPTAIRCYVSLGAVLTIFWTVCTTW